jgi:hypothetical protein
MPQFRTAPPAPEPAVEKPAGAVDLPFDPTEKASLPFEIDDGGQSFSPPPAPFSQPAGPAMPQMPGLPEMPPTESALPEAEESAPAEPAPAPKMAVVVDAAEEIKPKQVHILCPSGHPLEVTREMLGSPAQCPLCGKQFRLRWENSLEYRQRRARQLESQDAKSGQVWLAWAILAAVGILGGLVLLAMFAH